MFNKIKENANNASKSTWIAIALSMVLLIGGCGNTTSNSAKESVTETTEILEMTEATEGLEVIEATEAIEITEITEATEIIETETENESESEIIYTYTELTQTMYVSESVNVRNLPSKVGDLIGTLEKGIAVTVTGQCNETNWYRISYDGGTGYCSNNYLTSTKPSSGSCSGTGNSSSGSGSGSSSGSGDSSSDDGNMTYYNIADYVSEIADKIVELTNQEREEAGVSALTKGTVLTSMAEVRAEEQVSSFGHTRPDGSKWSTVFDDISYDTSSINVALASENATMFWCSASGEVTDIAHAISTYASCAVSNWMNSTSGHKENMLSSGHTSIGVGVFYSGGCLYCIQLFGHETKICSNHTWVSMDTVTYKDLDGNILIKNACYYCSVCGSLKNDDGYVTSGKYYFTSQ